MHIERETGRTCESRKGPGTRILVVYGEALFRECLVRVLRAEKDFQVVGEASGLEEAARLLEEVNPNTVLLHADLLDDTSISFCAPFRKLCDSAKVIVISVSASQAEAVRLAEQGARGIFLTRYSPELLAKCIRSIAQGEVWFDQAYMAPILGQLQAARAVTIKFTARELELLNCVSQGLSNKETAALLAISEATVKIGLQQLFRKTGVRTRGQLIRVSIANQAGH